MEPSAPGRLHRLNRKARGIVVGIHLVLPTTLIDHLPEVPDLVKQPYTHRRDAEVARGLR
jgi:hypothetical protein